MSPYQACGSGVVGFRHWIPLKESKSNVIQIPVSTNWFAPTGMMPQLLLGGWFGGVNDSEGWYSKSSNSTSTQHPCFNFLALNIGVSTHSKPEGLLSLIPLAMNMSQALLQYNRNGIVVGPLPFPPVDGESNCLMDCSQPVVQQSSCAAATSF
nr:hypothetical protein [Paucisalibacillus globulus]